MLLLSVFADVQAQEICSNGIDDDFDCNIDCDDQECGARTFVLSNGQAASFVLGQNNFTSNTSGTSTQKFDKPYDVTISNINGKVYVSDLLNHRVLRYTDIGNFISGGDPEIVLGQNNFTTGTSGVSDSKFDQPTGIFVDDLDNLWVTDWGNNRILKFEYASLLASGATADIVLGQTNFFSNSPGASAFALSGPIDAIVDDYGHLWVADQTNFRVLKFSNSEILTTGASASLVLGQPNFTTASYGVSASKMGEANSIEIICDNLYVSDGTNNRIIRFDNYNTLTSGQACDMVLGQNNYTDYAPGVGSSKFSEPRLMSKDRFNNLYVTDAVNHRVLVFDEVNSKTIGESADRVIGQPDFFDNSYGLSATKLNSPRSAVIIESEGSTFLLVSDISNHRFMAYGQEAFETDELTSVSGVLPGFDLSGGSLTYTLVTPPSDGLFTITDNAIGAFSFTPAGFCHFDEDDVETITYRVTNSSGCFIESDLLIKVLDIGPCPEDCGNGIDDDGDCLVDCDDSDCGSYPIALANGIDAQYITGQSDFSSFSSGTSSSKFNNPVHVARDTKSDRLFVSDYGNNRILIYENVEDFIDNRSAIHVLGQSNFISNFSGVSNTRLNKPTGLFIDKNGRLWVCDRYNNRVLWFDDAKNLTTGSPASGVLGQPHYASALPGISATKFDDPIGVLVDDYDNLWVADFYNERILKFENASSISIGDAATVVLGAPNFTTIEPTIASNTLGTASSISMSCNNLFVTDDSHNRVLVFKDAHLLNSSASADVVLGQISFNSASIGAGSNRLNNPSGISIDNNLLYISDTFNNRVLIYKDPNGLTNFDSADYVIGQTSFFGTSPRTTIDGFRQPHDVKVIRGNGINYLTVADRANNRLISFGQPKYATDELTNISGIMRGVSLTGVAPLIFDNVDSPYHGSVNVVNSTTGVFDYYPSVACTNGNDYNEYFRYSVTNSNGCIANNAVRIEVQSLNNCIEVCDNGLDDDQDGQIDEFDGDCDNDHDGVSNAKDFDRDNDGISDLMENDLTLSNCSNYEYVPLFHEDFGSGGRTSSDNTPLCYEHGIGTICSPEYDQSTFTNGVDWGEYAVVSNTNDANQGNYTWVVSGDYNGGTNNRMMVVNPVHVNDVVYSTQVENILPNARLYMRLHFLNLSPSGSGNPLPRVKVRVIAGTEESTSIAVDIPETGNWRTHWFYIGHVNNTIAEVQIINDLASGSTQAYVIDSIMLSQLLYDCDDDGIPNLADLDSDNDGIPDIIEQTNLDVEKNGVTDNIDVTGGLTSDANFNGWDDNYEGDLIIDTDNDGVRNILDLDSDNDGIYDVFEAKGTDGDLDGRVGVGAISDTDNNGYATSIDPAESGTVLAISDSDSDGIPDFLEIDSDNDGCFDVTEAGFPDSDSDGKLLNGTLGLDFNITDEGTITQ